MPTSSSPIDPLIKTLLLTDEQKAIFTGAVRFVREHRSDLADTLKELEKECPTVGTGKSNGPQLLWAQRELRAVATHDGRHGPDEDVRWARRAVVLATLAACKEDLSALGRLGQWQWETTGSILGEPVYDEKTKKVVGRLGDTGGKGSKDFAKPWLHGRWEILFAGRRPNGQADVPDGLEIAIEKALGVLGAEGKEETEKGHVSQGGGGKGGDVGAGGGNVNIYNNIEVAAPVVKVTVGVDAVATAAAVSGARSTVGVEGGERKRSRVGSGVLFLCTAIYGLSLWLPYRYGWLEIKAVRDNLWASLYWVAGLGVLGWWLGWLGLRRK